MFVVTIALGASAVVVIALAPLYADRLSSGSVELGSALVALAIATALLGLVTPGPSAAREDELFLCSFVLLVIGSVLVLRGDDEDGREQGDDDEPPWWPEFEASFRSYARRSRPLARIR
jgi:hypothetical protein